jgi:predicted SprT family Zn-dependent metalloprotease
MRIHKNVMNKTPEFVCKVISHEFLHYLLHVEYDGITSTQLDNLCEDSKTINNSGIDDW